MRKIEIQTQWGKDGYVLFGSGELKNAAFDYGGVIKSKMGGSSDWYGSTYTEFARQVVVGDPDLVKQSEKYMNQIEDQVPFSLGWRNVDDVVGAIPNVPAFLAGHPQCMRRRQRVMKETAPLVIYMDLTSSGGISSDRVQKRGIVLLSLVRRLVEHRPVALWVGSSLGGGGKVGSGTVAWRIDTAPLDLARAAFYISATVMSRGFGYGLCQHELGTGGSWPFHNYDLHCRTAKERLAAVFPGQEIMYVPPIYMGDELTD